MYQHADLFIVVMHSSFPHHPSAPKTTTTAVIFEQSEVEVILSDKAALEHELRIGGVKSHAYKQTQKHTHTHTRTHTRARNHMHTHT